MYIVLWIEFMMRFSPGPFWEEFEILARKSNVYVFFSVKWLPLKIIILFLGKADEIRHSFTKYFVVLTK